MTTTVMPGSTCLPRYATPRDERFPTLGDEVAEVSKRLGRPLMPWQLAVAQVAYEFDPVTGLFRYDEVDITVPRQSGKTTLTLAKKVHRLTVMSRRLGPQRSTYVAQTRVKARKKLEQDFAEALRSSRSFREVPHSRARPTKATEWRLSLNNGSEHFQFGSGSFLQIDAPSRTGGHGDTLDDGTIDEAFSQEDDTVEGGMRPSMATRKNAQLWVISTAGDRRSRYLWRKVQAGRDATETGTHGRVCYAEYSAPEDADPGDPATWWACMPALGITISEAFIQGEWDRARRKGPEGMATFRRAYLNQWPDIPVLETAGTATVVDLDQWAGLAVGNKPMKAPALSVEVAPNRSVATLGAAWTFKGRPHLEVVEDRPGVGWVVGRVAQLAQRYSAKAVVIDTGTEAAGLADELDKLGLKVVKVGSAERAAACGAWYDAATTAGLSHNGDPAIATAITNARWKDVGDGARVLSRRRSAGDIAALYAVVLAMHGLSQATTSDFYVL